jgi:hypothetical protein
MVGSKYIKNNVEYMKIDKVGVRTKFEKVTIYMDNLFNGNKGLADIGNQVVNENQQVFLDEIIPVVEKSLGKKFKKVANDIFKLASYDEFFPQ